LPWLAFFLARSLRFTVLLDIGDDSSGKDRGSTKRPRMAVA